MLHPQAPLPVLQLKGWHLEMVSSVPLVGEKAEYTDIDIAFLDDDHLTVDFIDDIVN